MGRTRLYYKLQAQYREEHPYKMLHWTDYNYEELSSILCFKKSGPKGNGKTYNDVFIMADTETSKKRPDSTLKKYDKKRNVTQIQYVGTNNHVCAWSIAIRAFDTNIVTLWGHRPDTLVTCIEKIHAAMPGDNTIIYWHNMPYDYVFERKFFFVKWGTPKKVLNVKPHYPIYLTFENGIMMKDSLILAQRRLEKWADDLDVEHKKAVGSWEYNKIRSQQEVFSEDELKYIECDVLAGVECLNKTADALGKRVYTLPYTATGIPREEVKKRGKKAHAHNEFLRQAPDYELYCILEQVYHGGFTHANRHLIEVIVNAFCYDESSAYPYQLLTMKAPAEKFTKLGKDVKIKYILHNSNEYGFIFKLTLAKFELKDKYFPMPPLQLSKCTKTVNCVVDNGRIIQGEYAEIWLNEIDLELINRYYSIGGNLCTDVYYAYKTYLPKWFTDYVYQCYYDKTMLKGGDPVAYAIAKAKLNSLYGMACMKNVKIPIEEDYLTGEYENKKDVNPEELYNKYVNNYETVLPYVWGIWCTSGALSQLFKLGECTAAGQHWVYSDTDSCYSTGFDKAKIKAFNDECKQNLINRGYGAVMFKGREYWLGIAEHNPDEDVHPEFVTVGAKRYAYTNTDGSVHITCAGVPKKNGAKCLKGDIKNFKANLVFDGPTTGKSMHTYFYVDNIYTDSKGNLTGDSINLSPCDYLLDSVHVVDWEKFFEEDIFIQVYDEDDFETLGGNNL